MGGLEYNSDHNVGTNPDRHLKIVNGDLQIGTAGHGIDFSATANAGGGTMSSELLDDYEEGSFTPAFKAENNSSNADTQVHEAAYTKVGNLVYFRFYITLTSHATGTTGVVLLSLVYHSLM